MKKQPSRPSRKATEAGDAEKEQLSDIVNKASDEEAWTPTKTLTSLMRLSGKLTMRLETKEKPLKTFGIFIKQI